MSKWMDKLGYRFKERNQDSKEILKAQKWIEDLLDEGATIPEAMMHVSGVIDIACQNVQAVLVRKALEKRVKKHYKSLQDRENTKRIKRLLKKR